MSVSTLTTACVVTRMWRHLLDEAEDRWAPCKWFVVELARACEYSLPTCSQARLAQARTVGRKIKNKGKEGRKKRKILLYSSYTCYFSLSCCCSCFVVPVSPVHVSVVVVVVVSFYLSFVILLNRPKSSAKLFTDNPLYSSVQGLQILQLSSNTIEHAPTQWDIRCTLQRKHWHK